MAKKIIRPIKGMDLDSALNRRDDKTIYMAENLRLNSVDGVSLGEYTNFKGTNRILNSSWQENILKMYKIADKIILFIKTNDVDNPDVIALINENNIPLQGESEIILNIDNYYWEIGPRSYKIIEGDFGFDEDFEINVKAYYEGDLIQKIYWAIEGEPLRALNIIYSDINDPSTLSANDIAMIPNADLSKPVINSVLSGGSLLCGKIYYVYQVSNTSGAESNLSELSNSIHLTISSESDTNDFDYKGYGIGVDSTKSVNITISNIPNAFNKIKIYSIHFGDDVSLPVINLVYDNFVSETVSFTDIGNALLELAAEEFLAFNNLHITGGRLEIKNNRLFVANYEEEFFDIDEYADGGYWDARAYGFNNSNVARIYDGDLITYTELDGGDSDYLSISQNHDCINLGNDLSSSLIDLYPYKSDGVAWGATGINIQLSQNTFDSDTLLYPDNTFDKFKWSASTSIAANGYQSQANPLNESKKVFKPEEVYRFGIQFKNAKGQFSYIKWINDYKIKYSSSSDYFEYFATIFPVDVSINARGTTIGFTINNIPTDPETGLEFPWRIVYVPIEEKDKGVYWGLFCELTKSGTNGYRSRTIFDHSSGTDSGKYLEFLNPDYSFGNKKTYDYMKIVRKYDASSTGVGFSLTNKFTLWKAYNLETDVSIDTNIVSINSQINYKYNIDVETETPLTGTDVFLSKMTGLLFTGTYAAGLNKGRCQIIEPDNSISGTHDENTSFWGCSYVNNISTKYGGRLFNERQVNGYIPLNEFSDAGDAFQKVYGDTYMCIYEHLRGISEGDNVTSGSTTDELHNEAITIPVFSSFNLNLRSDTFTSRYYPLDATYLTHEYAGIYSDQSDNILTQETDLYLFNRTYSRSQDLVQYYIKPAISSVIDEFKTRIITSQNKILGEHIDSFLKFDASSYIDVDGQYGEIVELRVFNDRLYFFQERAIGIVAVNEKAAATLSDSSELIIGELGVLGRYDYITTDYGVTNKNHIKVAGSNMYIIDEIRMEILKFDSKGLEPISITKNVDSLVKDKYWSDAIIVHNRKFNEVLFFYKTTSSSTCNALVYSEQVQAFTSIYTYTGKFIDTISVNRTDLRDEILLTTTPTYDMLTLNDGNYNQIHDESSYDPSSITFLIANQEEKIVLFNVLEVIIKLADEGSSGRDLDFIDTIRVYNATQDTGELDFTTVTKEKFNKYRTNKLRNYEGSNERILSDHIYVTITTTNNSFSFLGTTPNNFRVFFRDLITSFTEYNWFG